MRYFDSFSWTAVAIVLLLSGSAFALETEHAFTDLTGLSMGGIVNGTTIDGLAIGDTFEVGITLDNSAGDGIQAVFTYLIYDNDVINLVDGFSDASAFRPNPALVEIPSLFLALPREAVGQPAGTAIGIAVGVGNLGSGDGVYSSPNSGVVAAAIFEVVGPGETSIAHVNDLTIFNGIAQAPTFSDPLMVFVADSDEDSVPDAIDNCVDTPNGAE